MLTVKVEDEEAGSSHSAASSPERCRLRFRGFRYPEAAGPRAALRRLRQLCRLWLRPETRSKEQIVDLLVLEQFLAVLPAELRARVRGRCPESGEEAVVLLEGPERQLDEPRRQVEKQLSVREPCSVCSRILEDGVGGIPPRSTCAQSLCAR